MSMFLMHDKRLMTFREFLMLESLGPSPSEYGNNEDCDNHSVNHIQGLSYTFFKTKEYFYCASISPSGEVGFGAADTFSYDPTHYKDDRKKTQCALRVLNIFIYVVLQMASDRNLIKFTEVNPALGVIYARMVENIHFIENMKKVGWNFDGKEDHYFIFRKI